MTELPISSQLKRYLRNTEIDLDDPNDIPRDKVLKLLFHVENSFYEKKKEVSILDNALEISSRETQEYVKDLNEKSVLLTNSAKMSALGEMAGGVAHEINNPLAIISGISDRLLRKAMSGEQNPETIEDGLFTIKQTVQRIVEIVKGLRLISREADHDKKEIVSVIKIVSDSLVLCHEKFKNNNISFLRNYDDTLDLLVLGRATQFSQVLLNLLNNSFDSVCTLQKRWISIDIESQNTILKISVTDSGSKIDSEIIKKIMNPFFTTKEVGKGTGLGLSISKSIIEDHDGKLYYDINSPNASFVIELPLSKQVVKETESDE